MQNINTQIRQFFHWLWQKKWLLLTTIVIIVGIGWWWYQQQEKAKLPVSLESPIFQTITKNLEISGVLDAKEKVSLRFAMGGKVVFLGAKEGEFVKKGQVIATIDQADLRKRLEQDLNRYMQERWDWDQQLDDIKDRTINKKEQRQVDKNQWDLTNKVIDVEIRDIAIRDTVLRSPIEGVLIKTPTTVTGVQLLATDTFEIVNPKSLVFRALVDEADVSQVSTGQSVSIALDAFPDQQINAIVDWIGLQSVESSSGTSFEVEMKLNFIESLGKYRLGMNGDAEIKVAEKQVVLTVPTEAVIQEGEENFVNIVESDQTPIGQQANITTITSKKQPVTIGLQTDELTEILAGLSEQNQIILP